MCARLHGRILGTFFSYGCLPSSVYIDYLRPERCEASSLVGAMAANLSPRKKDAAVAWCAGFLVVFSGCIDFEICMKNQIPQCTHIIRYKAVSQATFRVYIKSVRKGPVNNCFSSIAFCQTIGAYQKTLRKFTSPGPF